MNAMPPLLLEATLQVLRRHAPFDAMDAEALAFLASRATLRYHPPGEAILGPEDGDVERLHIVQRGRVHGTPAGPVAMTPETNLDEGECFPVGALMGRRPTTLRYEAVGDTFCYELARPDFEVLLERSAEFQAFCTRRLVRLLEQSAAEVRATFASRAARELGMNSPLSSALRRPPVTLPPAAPVREALETMRNLRIGSVVVATEAGQAVGIFTQADVLDRVALARLDIERPLEVVMTRDPVMLAATCTLGEAAQVMARHGFRHVLVGEGGRVAGIVSERDLFALQRRSALGTRKEIERAATPEDLAFAARDASRLAATLLAQGLGAEPIMQLVTAMNDAVVHRAVGLVQERHGTGELGACWIGLGSEGRMEQTIATDQDNAIVFPDDPPGGREGARQRLLAFAADVNQLLADCGFPLCSGDIMARNPRWCLTLGEWRAQFDNWMRNTDPNALMNAAIFFDLRALAGDESLAQSLRDFLGASVPERSAFLRQMSASALQVRPPLGFLDEISAPAATGGMIDLKLHAIRPFVDAARVMALAAGAKATGTVARLQEAAAHWRVDERELEAAGQAFHYLQMLRLRRQEETGPAAALRSRNQIDPKALSTLDSRILKESLRQARRLQNRLSLEYRL